MNGFQTELHSLVVGHILLALCCVCYLAWWCVFFRPRPERPQGVEYGIGVALILAACVFGLIAVVRIVTALGSLPGAVPGRILWPCAIAVYIVLALVTSRAFGRPITTELLLIVAWTALEISVAMATGAFAQRSASAVLLALVIVAFAGSMACYLAYYHLSGWAAFYDGCGPLVAVGIYSAAFALIA